MIRRFALDATTAKSMMWTKRPERHVALTNAMDLILTVDFSSLLSLMVLCMP